MLRKPEARETLKITPLKWVVTRLVGVLVAWFEVGEPVITVCRFWSWGDISVCFAFEMVTVSR